MSNTESPIMRASHLAMVSDGSRLWRNNTGNFYQGDAQFPKLSRETVLIFKGDVVLRHFRRIQCGLAEGSADLVGCTPIIVTPEMVGHTVAVFTTPEAKSLTGAPKKNQRQWMEMVNGVGGIGFIFNSVEDARMRLAEGIARIKSGNSLS